MSVSSRYAEKPQIWNLSIMISVGGILWAALGFYINTEFAAHSNDLKSHPVIVSQLSDIRSDQLKAQILDMDKRICEQPGNNYYQSELIDLIDKWEKLNSPRKFPIQLLRCGG